VPALLRRHAVSIAIAILAAALGAYLYAVDSGRVTTKELESRKRNVFRAWRRADISEIAIEQQGETVRILKRTDDAGDVMYELAGGEPADPISVDKLMSVLEFATPERRVEQGGDRGAMGLGAPRARLRLTMGKIVYQLAIGGPAPVPAGSAYAELEGEGIFVVPRDLVTELTRSRDVYRGRTLVPYLSSSLSELGLEGAGGERRFVIGAWGGWAALRGEQKIRVDRDVFDRMLTALAEVRAEAFTNDSDADRALAEASVKVRIVMSPKDKGLPRAVIDVGGDCPSHPENIVAVHREPLPRKSACVPKGVLEALATPVGKFFDHHLFSLRPDEMEQIALVAGDDKLEIVRSGTGWHQRAPTDGPVEPDVGQSFARTLHDLTAESILDSQPGDSPGPSSAKEGRTATITKVDGGEERLGSETIELGARAPDGFVEARRQIDGARLRVTGDAAAALRPSGLALRSRKVIDESASRARRVAIESPTVRQVLRRSSTGGFTLEEPKSLSVDAGLANDVTEALVKLRAERWVADHDDGTFGMSPPSARYELDLEASQIRIETGRAAAGGVFARVVDRPEVFLLGESMRRAIETWAVDRSYFMVDPSEVRHVRFERGPTKWELDAETRGGPDPRAAVERFEVVRKVLAEARTEGVVHLGPARKEEGLDRPRLALTVRSVPPPPAEPREVRITVGRGDVWRDNNVFYVRRAGVDATFAMAQSKLRPLLDLQ
jgi:hypothetical protein